VGDKYHYGPDGNYIGRTSDNEPPRTGCGENVFTLILTFTLIIGGAALVNGKGCGFFKWPFHDAEKDWKESPTTVEKSGDGTVIHDGKREDCLQWLAKPEVPDGEYTFESTTTDFMGSHKTATFHVKKNGIVDPR
jgi:hypothetical protein